MLGELKIAWHSTVIKTATFIFRLHSSHWGKISEKSVCLEDCIHDLETGFECNSYKNSTVSIWRSGSDFILSRPLVMFSKLPECISARGRLLSYFTDEKGDCCLNFGQTLTWAHGGRIINCKVPALLQWSLRTRSRCCVFWLKQNRLYSSAGLMKTCGVH